MAMSSLNRKNHGHTNVVPCYVSVVHILMADCIIQGPFGNWINDEGPSAEFGRIRLIPC